MTVSKFQKDRFSDDVIMTLFLIFGSIANGENSVAKGNLTTTVLSSVNLTGWLQVRFKSDFIILSSSTGGDGQNGGSVQPTPETDLDVNF